MADSLSNQIRGIHVFIPCFRSRYFHCASVDGNADYSQAKRKKHVQRNSEAIRQMHAAQIYAEMLGQVCHEELYKDGEGFQEVLFVDFILVTDGPRHLFSTYDMRHFSYTGRYFRTATFKTSPSMVRII